MPAVEVGQTYHHRRVKDRSCQTYLAISPTKDRPGTSYGSTDYVLYSATEPLMMRRYLSPQSWHEAQECPYE